MEGGLFILFMVVFFCYWVCRSDVSFIHSECVFSFIIVFGLVVMDFLPFFACER